MAVCMLSSCIGEVLFQSMMPIRCFREQSYKNHLLDVFVEAAPQVTGNEKAGKVNHRRNFFHHFRRPWWSREFCPQVTGNENVGKVNRRRYFFIIFFVSPDGAVKSVLK